MKKIIILGSTGSIGRQTLEILRKDKKNFDVVLLSTDKNINLLFVDTVGFISDLPTTLVDSFKSTLDEIIYSDLILHIRDISNDYYLEQNKEVLKILQEIGIDNHEEKIIDVINKVDLIDNTNKLHNLVDEKTILISALEGIGIDNLKNKIYQKILT